jgi:FtsP/CotA-like multicopper oxidase with cupredoxin domain
MKTVNALKAALWAHLLLIPLTANAKLVGVTGTSFTLTAKADTISTSDGDSMWMWGYALGSARMQFPGPTLIVNQGDKVTVTLFNELPVPVSLLFPGQVVTPTGGTAGLLTREVPPSPLGANQPVQYTFTAGEPGTYSYYSGTRPDLEVEMGLVGALIVRPKVNGGVVLQQAYADASTAFDQEYLYLVSEADPVIHQQVAFHCSSNSPGCDLSGINMTNRHPVDWFVNGRNFPDTLADPGDASLPTQPYNAAPLIHPSDRILIRWVAAGVDLHPFHTHGQNHLVIARDGRLLRTPESPSPDLAISDYTTTNVPGETVDAIWGPWTGAKLGWDVYGTADINPHTCNAPAGSDFDPISHEYCPDHGKPIPVTLPSPSDRTFGVGGGGMWGGTPYLGVSGDIPPLNPGQPAQLNTVGGIAFMWHSHAERELTTNNIFIGGMATMALVVPVGTPVP